MRTIKLDGNDYQYSYKSHDLFIVIKLVTKGETFEAADYCCGLLVHVEDNEANAMLRLRLGQLILQDMSTAIEGIEAVKNVPVPSVPGKP
jgi:hypothetical protein